MANNPIVLLWSYFFITAVFCYGFIWVLLKSPLPNLFVDLPDPRKVHQSITPRAGGVCIILCLLSILLFWNKLNYLFIPFPIFDSKLLTSIVLFSFCIFLVGFLDDTLFINITNVHKLIYEIVITTMIILSFGNPLETIYISSDLSFHVGWVGIPLSIIWIVGVTNAVNIIDGIDGLAGSISLLSFIFIGILAGIAGQTSIVVLCVLLAGLTTGFLIHNISPSLIFLGDTGSLFLGIILGFLTLYIVTIPEMKYSILIAPMLVGFPLIDTFLAMFRRFMLAWIVKKKGLKSFGAIFKADGEHMHHRLMYKGLSHTNTCIIIVLFSSVLSISGVAINFVSNTVKVMIGIYLSILTLWFIYKLSFMNRITAFFTGKDYLSGEDHRYPIAIINANDVLRHSFEKCNQNSFLFDFFTQENFPVYKNSYSVVIISSSDERDQIEKEREFAELILKNKKNCYITIAAERDSLSGLAPMCKQKRIVFKTKPLYIPHLLNEIYPFARSNIHISAFSNTFLSP